MHTLIRRASLATLLYSVSFSFSTMLAQSAGNSGTIYGTVTDSTTAVIPNASVSLENPVSGYGRQTKTDNAGHFQFNNLPLNPYHVTVSAPSFSTTVQDVDVRSTVPIQSMGKKIGVLPRMDPNTEDDDHNPPRVAPRSLFDASLGVDNLLGGEKNKWSLRFTAVNFTNKYALYNFLSTFSGTHYVTPRALTAELGFHF